MTSDSDRSALLSLARKAIAEKLEGRKPPVAKLLPSGASAPSGSGGAFVTLRIGEHLRGCIGLLRSNEPVSETVAEMARSAAFGDPRFPALSRNELEEISVEISRLSEFFPITPDEVVVGKHGLLLRLGFRSGLLLPQVPGEQGWNKEQYLSGLCRKAGLPDGAYNDPEAELLAFTAEVFGEN